MSHIARMCIEPKHIALTKMIFVDLVIVPESRVPATQQWGLLTFRESAVFHQPGVDTCDKYISKVTTLTHEIAHTVCINLFIIMDLNPPIYGRAMIYMHCNPHSLRRFN